MKIWKPDTCECIVEYEPWPDPSTLGNKIISIMKSCPAHIGLTVLDMDTIVNEENTRKNRVIARLMQDSLLGEDYVDEEGNTQRRFKRSAKVDWKFNSLRELEITISGVAVNKVMLKLSMGDISNKVNFI